jgi:Ni/Fe-hydrogenase 1 B-type cytochrome subunit
LNFQNLQRKYIWPGHLRLGHWLMSIAVIGLLLTGWLLQNVVQYFQIALDYHYIMAYILSFAVSLRLFLLVRSPASAAGWHDLVPNKDSLYKAFAMLRFYVSLGRTPLPRWYAHSPLWAPTYLLLFFLLLIQIMSGFLIGAGQHTLLVNLYTLHNFTSTFIAVFAAAHIISVFLHDLKAGTSDISGMIHGYRIFTIEKPELPGTIQTVSLDKLKHRSTD